MTLLIGSALVVGGVLWGFVDILRAADYEVELPWHALCALLVGVNIVIFDAITRLPL